RAGPRGDGRGRGDADVSSGSHGGAGRSRDQGAEAGAASLRGGSAPRDRAGMVDPRSRARGGRREPGDRSASLMTLAPHRRGDAVVITLSRPPASAERGDSPEPSDNSVT